MRKFAEALSKTLEKMYIKADGTLAVTMIFSDTVTALGAVQVFLEMYGYKTGAFASAITVLTGILSRQLRKRTDVPMLAVVEKESK